MGGLNGVPWSGWEGQGGLGKQEADGATLGRSETADPKGWVGLKHKESTRTGSLACLRPCHKYNTRALG